MRSMPGIRALVTRDRRQYHFETKLEIVRRHVKGESGGGGVKRRGGIPPTEQQRKKNKTKRSVWTVSGGLPTLGKARR
jgi:hypothetical protein